ncbi:MAG: hypothetical protein VW338_15625 [Rhodospirillaceae bacterium]
MKNMLLVLGASAIMAGWPILQASQADDGALPMAKLQAAGWTVVDKREEKQERPGVAPYQNLVRIVQLVHFRLEKDGQVMRCTAEYDSQRDKYSGTSRAGGR